MALNFLNNGYFAGTVGIGTDSPPEVFSIRKNVAGGDVAIYLQNYNSVVGSTDETVSIKFAHGNDGGNGYVGAKIVGGKDGDFESNPANVKGFMSFNTNQGSLTTLTEAMRIQSDATVYVKGQNNGYDGTIRIGERAFIEHRDAGQTTTSIISNYNHDNAKINFKLRSVTDTNAQMTIKGTGDVGIGTDGPDSRLTVSSGTTNAVANFKSTDAAAYIAIADNSSTNALVNQIGVTGNDMWFATDDVEKLRITSSGQVGIGGTPQTTLADAVTIEIGASGIIYSEKAASQYNSVSIGQNWYYDSTNSRVEYKNAVIPGATNYLQYQGEHVFRTAVAPTAADDPITWSNRLIISNDGDIGIGSGTINGRVDIKMDMAGESFVPNGTSAQWAKIWNSAGALGDYFNDAMLHLNTNRAGGATGGAVGIAFSPGWSNHQNWGIYSLNTTGNTYSSGDLAFVSQLNDGTITERVRFNGVNGNVGIGTDDPVQKLQVNGQVLFRTTTVDGGKNRFQLIPGGSSDAANLYLYYGNTGDGTLSVRINAQGDSYFNGGSVGIGVTGPKSKLQVDGGIQMADDTDPAVANKAGTMRYRTATNEPVPITGTDLVTNGDLASSTGWYLQNLSSINNTTGVATVISGSTYSGAISATGGNWSLYQQSVMDPSKTYMLRFQARRDAGPNVNMYAGRAYQVVFSQTVTAAWVQYQAVFTTGTQAWYELTFGGATGATFEVKDIAVVEVTEENASYADMCMQTGSSTYEWINIVRNTY